jgi:hypothetical protein
MEDNNFIMAERLLKKAPQQEKHTQENIIPPVGIANPELLQSFMSNLGDEEKIMRDIKNVEEYHRENPLQTAEREVKSYGLRALEGLGGTIGGLMNLLSGEAYFDDKGDLLQSEVPMLPSTHQLREFSKEKTGNKYEPRTEFAKNAHEAATDVGASLPLPGSWFQKLLLPVSGQSVKALVKNQGGNEFQGDMSKLGFMMAATIGNIGNAPQAARNAYNEATQMIPQGTRMATRQVENGLNTIRNRPWFRTGRTASKGPAMEEIQRIENSIQHGSMDVHEAMQIRRDINEARRRLGAFHYEPGMDKAQARRFLDEVDEVMRDGLQGYGSQNNPQWYRAYERANEAYGVTQRSLQLQDFIKNSPVGRTLQSQTAKTLFHLGGASAVIHTPALIFGAAPLATATKGVQVINRMIRSPVLRNHYLDVIRAASAQNAGALNIALTKFDKEAQKLEKR